MELFDQTGTEYHRNVLWIIALAAVGIFLTVAYKDTVEREKNEAKYLETTAVVTNVEQWKRTRKRNGRETGSELYYKFTYKYSVAGCSYDGSSQSKDEPGGRLLVFYNPRSPSVHVLKRQTSAEMLGILVVGGILILMFIGVNIFLYRQKRAKLGLGSGSCGKFV